MERFIFAGPFGFIMPERIYWSSVTYPFFPAVMRRVENVAYKGSLRLVLCNTDNDPQKEISYLNELRTYRPAGGIQQHLGGAARRGRGSLIERFFWSPQQEIKNGSDPV